MIRTVGLLVFVCKITSRQFEPKNTLNLCCYLKLRRVARREHDSRGRALPQGGNMPFSPRRIDHDVGGKATRYPVQESERMVVEELGPGYAHAGGYPRSVVVGRALISNARQHVLHFVRVETGRIGRRNKGACECGCGKRLSACAILALPTSRWPEYEGRTEQQAPGSTRRALCRRFP